MKLRREIHPRQFLIYGAGAGAIFLPYFLYLWLVVDLRLVYHSIGIFVPYAFSTGWLFFEEHLSRPGGLTEYAARWLSQGLAVGWLGALIATAGAWSASLGVDVLTGAAGRPRSVAVRYVPAILLVVAWGSYNDPLWPLLVVLVAAACFAVYVSGSQRSVVQSVLALLAGCVVVYLAAGSGGLLFPLLVAIYEALIRRRWPLALAAVACGAGIPWGVGAAVYGRGLGEALGDLAELAEAVSAPVRPWMLVLFLWQAAVLAMAALTANLAAWRRRKVSASSPEAETAPGRLQAGRLRAAQGALVLLASGIVAWLSLDGNTKVMLLADYYSEREMWAEVLETARRGPYGVFNPSCNRNVMLALYHTGRLGDEMFCYPQMMNRSLYVTPEAERGAHSYFQEGRLLLELGQVNRAERCACEAFETSQEVPAILRQLAVINLVKGRCEAARMFLKSLARKPFYRQEAMNMLERLEADPGLKNDPHICELRRSMVTTDSASPQKIEQFLTALLEKNPGNRMAFEFLMAHLLCSSRPDKAAARLSAPMPLEYPRLPRHFQEAIIASSLAMTRQLPPADDRVAPEILDRARRFLEILNDSKDDADAARARAVAEGLGDSYFFYYSFGISGL